MDQREEEKLLQIFNFAEKSLLAVERFSIRYLRNGLFGIVVRLGCERPFLGQLRMLPLFDARMSISLLWYPQKGFSCVSNDVGVSRGEV